MAGHDAEHGNMDVNYDADATTGQKGYFPATDWTLPYMSPWSRIHHHPETAGMLRHVNCSYLGQPGMPPTLLALKQHARSLAALIAYLEPSVNSGRVDGTNFGDRENLDDPQRRLDYAGAFDWLSRLDQPYTNDDPNHHRPLNALVNEVAARSEITGNAYHCPLAEVRPRQLAEDANNQYYAAEVAARPYASHHNLVMHANECLERLDHEFSATGGLMSLIPPEGRGDEDSAELAAAKNTLLGQMIVHIQAMHLRQSELETSYSNALDVLGKEAVVPLQELSMFGPDGRTGGRPIAYPQDRWVLANAGDNVWNYLHDTFDKREAQIEVKEDIYRQGGLSGWRQYLQERGGTEYLRGIVPISVMTRYYRLKGKGRSTIFVVPASDHHPGMEFSRMAEKHCRVVDVVTPRWPERVSDWERKFQAQITAAQAKDRDNALLRQEKQDHKAQIDALRREVERQEALRNATTKILVDVGAVGDSDEQKKTALKAQINSMAAVQARLDLATEEIARLSRQRRNGGGRVDEDM